MPSTPPRSRQLLSSPTSLATTLINSRDHHPHHPASLSSSPNEQPPPIQISSDMQQPSSSSSSSQPSYSQLLPLLGGANRSNRNSHQSSAPSFESENRLSPRQRQITSETSSCPSDNEISSLYGKYRHSGCSLNENFEAQDSPQDSGNNSGGQDSFTQGDDANGLSVRKSGVIDELNWMLGEAIDSAQTTFGNTEDQVSPESQPPLTHVRSYSPLVNGLESLSVDKERTLHTPEGIQPGEQSTEDLSEPITASSLSDYSADPTDDSQAAKSERQRRRVYNLTDSSSCAVNEGLKEYSAYDLTALSKSQNDTLPQTHSKLEQPLTKEYAESAISAAAQSASSEEVLSSSALEDSNVQLFRRSPSQRRNPFIIGTKLQDLVAARKQDALRETHQSTSSDRSESALPLTPSAIISTEDLNTSNPLLKSNSQKIVNSSAKKLVEEDQNRLPKSASPNGKPLTARSPVVKRSSSDMNFLEQWQWLEAQHPSSSPPKKKHSIPTTENKPNRITAPTSREKCIKTLDDHFRSTNGSTELSKKMNILSQRQQNLQQTLQRHNNINNANKSSRPIKPIGAWFDRVPTINTKDLKKVKATADRCQIYEAKLQQLYSAPMGLDLWVWLKTCGESQNSLLPAGSSSTHTQARKPGYSPLMSHHQPPLSSLPPHLQHQPSGNSQQSAAALAQMRDTSMSSVASFPLRAGNSQKAIQIRRGSENQLMEIGHPDPAAPRSNGMIVNSLMEVNNLPYPSLYPHSVGQHLGIHQAPVENSNNNNSSSSNHTNGGPTSSRMAGGSRSLLENNSKSGGGGGAGGRFFSQITRHNSTKRRNHSASATSSPSKSNLVISAPLIAGPSGAPRGPRPEHSGPFTKSPAAELKSFFAKAHEVAVGGQARHSPELEPLPPLSPASSRNQLRMSFAYGSAASNRHPPPNINTLPTNLNNRLAYQQHHQSSASIGTAIVEPAPMTPHRRPSQLASEAHYLFSNPFHTLPSDSDPHSSSKTLSPPVTSTTSSDRNLNSLIDLKLDKLVDILPQADRLLLRKLLIDNQLDDVVTIGSYLELVKNQS
ncbi:hypothetical protein PGT21_014768 [Puccinia graminis f. sp. tritici]|nr:hypothetical protein PGT21_014768 [Puccinia graminis f. sp. tritici]